LSELVFVKLGGSIITDKLQEATARPEVILRLAGEIEVARQADPGLRLLLGHGSGSFGHTAGLKYHLRQGLDESASWWGYAETGAAAARLNRIVVDAFLTMGVPVVSIQPSASARCRGGKLVELDLYAIGEVLRRGLVPLIFGDVAFDQEQGCTIISTENILSYLAAKLHPARIVLVGEVDGVYDRDPLGSAAARRIPRITAATFPEVLARLGGSHGIDVTGGMLTKVREMMDLVAQGQTDRVHLISGQRPGALTQVLLDPDAAGGTVLE
jgi:isopentenyl phosphate kinase